MSVKVEIVTVTPEMASEWLTKSRVNRTMREKKVLAYSEAMRRGEWYVTDSGIGFTEDGALINGHHRLNAVIRAGVAIQTAVFRGLSSQAKGAIDCGIGRSLNDRLRMFRPTVENVSMKTSALKMCTVLLTSRQVEILTLDDYDNWLRLFRPGVEWAVGLFVGKKNSQLATSPIVGALAYAHRTNPEMVEAFGLALYEGSGLKKNSPELTLRNFLTSSYVKNKGGDFRFSIARKVLNAALAALEGRELIKIQDGHVGLRYFSSVYENSKAADKISEPWIDSEQRRRLAEVVG